MNSKEALKRLYYDAISSIIDEEIETINREEIEKDYMNVKQDLDRVEMLEKALDKACELLADYTGICPFSKKLMYETNCDLNCKDTYKECWKKYFMKEVLGNKWYNKPLPAFAPEENYDYSFVNDCLQKAEKYDCERLEKENQELKNTILSLELDTCIPELRKENTKLKKAIEILKENHEITLHYDDEFPTPMININGVYSYINKQEYELLKEVLEND